MFALALATSLLDIGGGGTDYVSPAYLDEVDFSTPTYSAASLSDEAKERIAFYRDELSLKEAYAWYLGEDNRAYGLKDVAESFENIYIGYTVDVEDGVTIYLNSSVKSGGIPRLLESYDVDAHLVVLDEAPDLEKAAFDFILDHGSDDYRSIRPNDDGTALIVTTSDEAAADVGPVIIGTAFDGVPITFEPAPSGNLDQ